MKIEINWDAVAEEIRLGDYSTRDSLKEAVKKAQQMIHDQWQEQQRLAEEARVKALKAMPRGAAVYYTGTDLRLLGKQGMKSQDGRVYMTVAVNGKLWSIKYSQVQDKPMSDTDLQVKRGIINAFSRVSL